MRRLRLDTLWFVTDTLSRHNLGVGLPRSGRIHFDGSVGYYCGGLNTGTDVRVENNAGWGTGRGDEWWEPLLLMDIRACQLVPQCSAG